MLIPGNNNDNDHRPYRLTVTEEACDYINEITPELLLRVQRGMLVAQDKLKGVRWITKNPGRQWTSSINPMISDPRDWYGHYYRRFVIGNEPLETTLRCLRKFTNSPWRILNNDIFEKLITLISCHS